MWDVYRKLLCAGLARGPPPGTMWQAASNEDPVHYFTMGHMPGWRSSPAWPPPKLGNAAKTLYLAGSAFDWSRSILRLFLWGSMRRVE